MAPPENEIVRERNPKWSPLNWFDLDWTDANGIQWTSFEVDWEWGNQKHPAGWSRAEWRRQ